MYIMFHTFIYLTYDWGGKLSDSIFQKAVCGVAPTTFLFLHHRKDNYVIMASANMSQDIFKTCEQFYCTALHCTALHCTALHCTALHCTALHCTALHCTVLHCTRSICC